MTMCNVRKKNRIRGNFQKNRLETDANFDCESATGLQKPNFEILANQKPVRYPTRSIDVRKPFFTIHKQ